MDFMFKGMIFDLDGTLVDTIEDLADAMNHGLAGLDCPTLTIEQAAQMVGSGLKNFVLQALPADRQDLHTELLGRMVSFYKQNCLNKTRPYEGMVETLDTLMQRGIRLAVLTNKNQAPAEIIVHHFFGRGLFNPVIGALEGRKVKPDPQTTLGIISGWGMDNTEVLYVGDSDIDILTAKAAEIECAACQWGYRSPDQLKAAGAETIIQHPRQLLDFLGCGCSGRP
jgi:phosphoglycolate phosphatase